MLIRPHRALYVKNDPYESTDAVFGVKNSLIVEVLEIDDEEQASRYGVEIGTALIRYDFVLVTESAAAELRKEKTQEAMAAQGRRFQLIDGLPVPDID